MKEAEDAMRRRAETPDKKQHPLWLVFVYLSLLAWTVWNILKTWN